MPRRSDLYFQLTTLLLVLAGIMVSVNESLYAAAVAADPLRPHSFWGYWPMFVAEPLAFFGVALFVGGIAGWRFPPWRQPEFPDLEIEINGLQRRDAGVAHGKPVWIAYQLRITNRETDQNASLTIRYRGKVGPGVPGGETLFVTPSGSPPDEFPADWLAVPLNLLPQHSAGGHYVAMVEAMWWTQMVRPCEESLLIEDHVSRKAVAIPAGWPGGPYRRSNWSIPHQDANGDWTVYPAST